LRPQIPPPVQTGYGYGLGHFWPVEPYRKGVPATDLSSFFPAPEVVNLLDKYNRLAVQETQLVQHLRESPDPLTRRTLALQLQSILQQKLSEINNFSSVDSPDQTTYANVLRFESEPVGGVVATTSRFLPIVALFVTEDLLLPLAKEGKLQVRCSLVPNDSDTVLQGQITSLVSPEGRVSFTKLRADSTHPVIKFTLQFQLEEKKNSLEHISILGTPLKTGQFQIRQGNQKRKRSSASSATSLSSSGGGVRKKTRMESSDSTYVDITSLLNVPQKEAANRLGISESMLCKRFKETTKRKWPYRYLRKIDKMVNLLTLNKRGEAMAPEDLEKMEKLKEERAECLLPVKIRITGYDVTQHSLHNISRGSPSGSDSWDSESDESEDELSPKKEIIKEEDDDDDGEEIARVVSTLNFLRQSK